MQQNLERKNGDVDKKEPDTSGLMATTVLNRKLKLRTKYWIIAV